MPEAQLIDHVRSELARGADRTGLIQALLATGWKVADIQAAIALVDAAAAPQAPPVPSAPQAPGRQEHITVGAGPASLKRTIQNIAAALFIGCVVVLSVISIMGVWEFFSGDVIAKSFATLGLLAFVAVLVIVASKFVGDPAKESAEAPPMPSPGYRAIRNITLVTLIVSSVLLALLGVLAIWEVIDDSSTILKSLSSLGIVSFASLIIVMVCLEREQNSFWKKRAREMTGGSVILGIILLWMLFAFIN